MKDKPHIAVIIPAFNEENSVGKVVNDIPKDWVKEIIVANNNSNDLTPINAKKAGAIVVDEPVQGYGNACLKGMAYLVENNIDFLNGMEDQVLIMNDTMFRLTTIHGIDEFNTFRKKVLGNKRGYFALIFFWISMEYIHLHWELAWPWLTLGNVFATIPEIVQWYEFTGVLGGSMWVLVINILLFIFSPVNPLYISSLPCLS